MEKRVRREVAVSTFVDFAVAAYATRVGTSWSEAAEQAMASGIPALLASLPEANGEPPDEHALRESFEGWLAAGGAGAATVPALPYPAPPKLLVKQAGIWVACASLIHPSVVPRTMVPAAAIVRQYRRLFGRGYDFARVQLEHHLVSWQGRAADSTRPARGGSRVRYLFRTSDGIHPDVDGGFRLSRAADAPFEHPDKTGPVRPEPQDVDPRFHALLSWHEQCYYPF
jgi:hypothetical protein